MIKMRDGKEVVVYAVIILQTDNLVSSDQTQFKM
jgi:hypothetical protein